MAVVRIDSELLLDYSALFAEDNSGNIELFCGIPGIATRTGCTGISPSEVYVVQGCAVSINPLKVRSCQNCVEENLDPAASQYLLAVNN